jgi:hypothetical protein
MGAPPVRRCGGVCSILPLSVVALTDRAPNVPKQRFTAVANGQQRSSAELTDMRHRRTASSATVLPKLAVAAQLRAGDSAIVLPN